MRRQIKRMIDRDSRKKMERKMIRIMMGRKVKGK